MSNSFINEVQKPNPSAIIDLFELELVEGLHYKTGNPDNVETIYRWYSGYQTSHVSGILTFNSKNYSPMPIEAEGFDLKSGKSDSLPRPVLRVSNLLGTMSTILIEVNKVTSGNDLLNAKLTRIRTAAMFLDSANFANVGKTFRVTVVNVGGANYFALDGVKNPVITLIKNNTYIFDQSDPSNTGHPLNFRDANDAAYGTASVVGIPGNLNASTTFTVPSDAPSSLKYYCTVHGNGMGNNIIVEDTFTNTSADPNATARIESFIVDRKSSENMSVVEFELSAIWDLPTLKLPRRQVLPRQFPGIGSFHA